MKKLLSLILIFFLILVILGGWWNSQNSSVSGDTATKVVVIPKGEGVSAIADRLKSEGLIKSPLAFKVYARLNNLADKIQAGSFKISPSMNIEQIAKVLSTGTDDVWVTLIEGWRVEQMSEELAKYFGDNSEVFVTNAKEGYMFPDTYLFPKDATGEYIANKLKSTFEERYNQDLRDKIKDLGLTEEEGVILASMVEREGRSDEVRKQVASIMLKRFNMGMKLDIDATVQYAIGYQSGEKSWWKRHLSRDDLKIDSPYNTYTNPGLPPTPICSPSLSSLEAVANANPNTPYLYYYHDLEGNSYYGRTLEEHNANVNSHP